MATNGDRPGVHPPNAQYLEAIFSLDEEGSQVIQARLAERVGHSAPTVSEMVHRLREAGYIEVQGRSLSLTPSGRDLATSVIRKHRLAERLMTDIIGLPWHKVHAEADRWEHVISDEVEARLVKILGNPATCPHGNFIPGSGHPPVPATALAEARAGQVVRLTRISEIVELDMDALVFLEDNCFMPGSEATVVTRGDDGGLVLQIGETSFVLGANLTKLLYFTPVEATTGVRSAEEERASLQLSR
jgi:DtxR family Mn-dependent transcriptional regulator